MPIRANGQGQAGKAAVRRRDRMRLVAGCRVPVRRSLLALLRTRQVRLQIHPVRRRNRPVDSDRRLVRLLPRRLRPLRHPELCSPWG